MLDYRGVGLARFHCNSIMTVVGKILSDSGAFNNAVW